MAYPPTPTLTAVNCPVPKSYAGIHDPATDGTRTSTAQVQGGTISASAWNAQAARGDIGDRIGGGIWGLVPGSAGTDLNLSTTSGLTLNIAEGLVQMDGPVYYAGGSVTLTDNISRVYLFISQAGSIVQVNASLTPPAGAHVFLGSCVTSAGSISGIDFSGVMYLQGTAAVRFTADAAVPGDGASLPGNICFYQRSTGGLWFYDGDLYWFQASGTSGTVPVTGGGTGATTAEGARTNLGVNSILLFASTATATVANTTTESSLIGSGVGSLTLAANQLTVGRSIRITARGLKSTAAVPGTLTVAGKLGATTLTTTGAQTPEASLTDNVWEVQLLITCRTTGASGSVFVQGFYRTTAGAGVGNAVQWEMGATSSATIDTTASQLIDLTGDWSVADAANDLRGSNCVVEQLG